MIKALLDFSRIAAALAFLGFVALSAIGAVLEKAVKGEEARKKAGDIAITVASVLSLVLGFSVIPIIVGLLVALFHDAVPAETGFIEENDMLIVFAFWALYLAGLAIALPEMRRNGFFDSKKG